MSAKFVRLSDDSMSWKCGACGQAIELPSSGHDCTQFIKFGPPPKGPVPGMIRFHRDDPEFQKYRHMSDGPMSDIIIVIDHSDPIACGNTYTIDDVWKDNPWRGVIGVNKR